MAQWTVSDMGGEMPLKDARLLPENNAAEAWNCDLNSGALDGLPAPELVKDLSAVGGTIQRAYRFPGPTVGVDPDVWLPLPSPFSSVVRGPLANDTLHRIYWTNPAGSAGSFTPAVSISAGVLGDSSDAPPATPSPPGASTNGGGGFWNTYARLAAVPPLPNYTLGFLPVEAWWVPVPVASGGSVPTATSTSVTLVAAGLGYVPGDIMSAPGGALAAGQTATTVECNATTVETLAVANGGSGGTDGTALVNGTTGTGQVWTGTATISGGTITALTLNSGGAYSANPAINGDPIVVNTAGYGSGPGVVTYSAGWIALNQYFATNLGTTLAVQLATNHLPYTWYPPGPPQPPVIYTVAANETIAPGPMVGPGVGLVGPTANLGMGIAAVGMHAGAGYAAPPTNPVALTGGSGTGATVNLGITTSAGAPEVERSYLFTYVDEYGQESSPSVPSVVAAGASDATWRVYGMSNVAPTAYSGGIYPVVTKIRVYRTVTGATTGGNFYQVADIALPSGIDPGVGWVDTIPDSAIVNNNVLVSTSWAQPPAGLDGLTQMPGGMLVGFTENTIHFCEPDLPNVWPASYDLSCNYQIVGLAVWQSSLVILTAGYPSTGSGNSPANFALSQVQVAEPCISRGSILADLLGVYYASPNGICMLNYYGMTNQTLQLITKNQWLVEFNAAQIIACRHRSQYLALDGVGAGFLVDYADQRSGLVHLNTFNAAVCIWNDVYSGDVYILSNKMVYRWDSPITGPMVWRWRSKRWITPEPISLGACEIILDQSITETTPADEPLDNGDPLMDLPAGVNALFRLFHDDGVMLLERPLTKETEIFRLPSGFKSFDWQFEILSRVPVFRVKLASSMLELRKP
jgi:hypothetical protein